MTAEGKGNEDVTAEGDGNEDVTAEGDGNEDVTAEGDGSDGSRPGDAPPARIFVGLGSSVRPEESIRIALEILSGVRNVHLTGISTLYRTPALPAPGEPPEAREEDPDFLNGVLALETSLSPEGVERVLRDVEEKLGRTRSADRFAPRTLDLDLLLYLARGTREVPGSGASPPAPTPPPTPEIWTRPFVAVPLLELAPDLKLPPDGTPLAAVAARFQGPGGTPELRLTRTLRTRFLEG